MKVLIIEDELMAQATLARTLTKNWPGIDIVGMLTSVAESVEWLSNNSVDVIFMDVELSDGICFEIFRQVDVKARVIMTTAYDDYAVKAFEEGSVDYLLKPVDIDALRRAMSRVVTTKPQPDWSALRSRYLVHFNDKIVPVDSSRIAYFYSEDKNNFMMTKEGKSYVVDSSLEDIASGLDPGRFFKISRSCIVSLDAVGTITKQMGGRLVIDAVPKAPFEMSVSRSRSDEFLSWLQK